MSAKLRFTHAGYTLISHLFRRYLTENDLDTQQAESVTIRHFYNWIQAQIELGKLFPDKDNLKEVYNLEDEPFEFVEELFSNPFSACAKLYSWWPLLTLAGRPKPRQKVTAIALTVAVQYEDGVIARFPMPLGLQSEPFTEGMALALWRGQITMVGQMLKSKSLDQIHDLITAAGETDANLDIAVSEQFVSDITGEDDEEYESDED
jgi:hypothetical protein